MKTPFIANQLPVGTRLEEGTVDVSWVVNGDKREEPGILEEGVLFVLWQVKTKIRTSSGKQPNDDEKD